MKIVIFLLVTFSAPAAALWNKQRYNQGCQPARDCVNENTCYCSGLFDGWKNGGMAPYVSAEGAFCFKDGRDCQCNDCGMWFANGDQCQEARCNDEVGVVENGKCYHIDPSTGERIKKSGNIDKQFGEDTNFNCYKVKVACDISICGYSKKLVGCKRVSPGSCVDCPALADGHFWARKGSCDMTRCTTVGPGKFLAKACTATTDAVVAGCEAHPGNPKYVVPRQDGKATYYCPGGGLVLPLPENSVPTPDYTNFVCNEGYYLSGASSCMPCLPGYACKHGRAFKCPMHYYTSTFAMTSCKRCATPTECSSWQYPLRCGEGSTANPGCVSCGGCSYDPRQGLACVTDAYEMQGLPPECVPSNAVGDVAVCG